MKTQLYVQRRRTTGPLLSLLIGLLTLVGLNSASTQAAVSPMLTYTVINTNDSGAGSLRQAILNANGNAGPDIIDFNIPGAGVKTIIPLTALPPIIDPVTINGYSQPGSSCNTLAVGNNAVPLIELNGNSLAASGLVILSGNSTVRGLVINRFGIDGIELQVTGVNTITGNFIGTNATGTGPASNLQRGINITTPNNFIGTALPCDRNLISANVFNGIHISGQTATNNLVYNNYIGTNAAGLAALPNMGSGVLIQSASNNQIGSPATGTGNVISGNEGTGIIISDNGSPANLNRVRGNIIGANATNTGALGNTRWGIQILGTSLNQIGGTGTGAGNVIAYNTFDGIMMVLANNASNLVRTNSIHDNTDLGIDLNSDFVTLNDNMDPDTGPNTLQNFPVLSASSTTSVVQGSFNSTPNSTFTLEFFYNTACDPSGYGEGETPDGSTMVTTDALGNATFSYVLPVTAPSGSFLTATAIDSVGNTSEFSLCQQVFGGGNPTATPTCPVGTQCATSTPTPCSAGCVTPTATPTNCGAAGCNSPTPSPTCQPGVPGCSTATPTFCPQPCVTATPTCQPGIPGCGTNTPTPHPTDTSTNTATRTSTNTATRTIPATNTSTSTSTNTATRVASSTPTFCPQPCVTATPTCPVGTQCASATPTFCPQPCVTATPTCQPGIPGCGTNTPTPHPTDTSTNTATRTATGTSTNTATRTNTSTPSPTPTCIILGHYTATVVPVTATIIAGNISTHNSCDDCLSQVEFPFPVQFYGETYSKAVASSNGNLQFVPESITSTSECLPNPLLDTAILLYQGDLDTSGQGEGVFTGTIGTAPNRTFIVEWRAHYVGQPGTLNAEILFYENSTDIEMVYGTSDDQGAHHISGMQLGIGGGEGGQYNQYSCNQPLLTAGKKIKWTWNPPIILCTPTPTTTRTNTATATPTICIVTALNNGFESGTLEGYSSVVATCVPGGCGWTNVTTAAHTGTRSLFAPDVNMPSDQQLVSPMFTVPAGMPKLVFWHRYALEWPLWDGGIIEISPNGGPWATITPSAITPPYPPGVIPGTFLNPLVGKQAWTKKNASYPAFDQITVDLSPYAGIPNTRFRFRLGTDQGNAGSGPALGWWIDDITVTGICATATPTRTKTPTRTITPTRTPTLPCVPTPVSMTHWWPFDETTGSIANELVFGANATEYNSPAHIPGMVSNALNFNGVNQYAAVLPPWNSPQLGTGDFTIDMWINVPASSLVGTQVFIDGRDFAPRGYEMFLVSGRLGLQMADQLPPPSGYSNYIAPASSALTTGWHFIAATVSRTTNGGRLYVDGVPVLTFTPRMGNLSNGAPLWIGRHHPNSIVNQTSWFNGSLDEIEFFRRALTPNEISSLYNAGNGGKCKPLPAPPTATPTPGPCWWCATDVQIGSTFHLFVANLMYQRVVTGYPCGGPNEPCDPNNYPYYRPNANVTRGQIAKIVSISAGFNDAPTGQTFEDIPTTHTFYLWIEQLASRGYIGGYPCGGPGEPCGPSNLPYFRPGNNATRGQLSKIVANAALINDDPGAQRFQDVPSDSTFYAFINPLAQREVISGYPCGSIPSEPCIGPGNLPYFRPSNNVTRGQAAKIVANVFWLDDWMEP